MNSELIVRLFQSFESIVHREDGVEYWLARELQALLGYVEWRKFQLAIGRAAEACRTSGQRVEDHFGGAAKMVEVGSGAHRSVADFARIRSKGDAALFGGHTTRDMKRLLGAPETRPLADFLPTITMKAKDLANEMTAFKVKARDLRTEPDIADEHVDNNSEVRAALGARGIRPEVLPPAEDIRKLERRLATEKKALPVMSDPPDASQEE